MCQLTLAVSHPHRRRTGGSEGATRRGVRSDLGGVSQLTLAPTMILSSFYFFYFVIRLPLCNNTLMFCDIYLYTLCYYICCLLGACMRCTWLCSLKPGVTQSKFHESKAFSSLCSLQNLFSSKGLVKISASWFSMLI
jgi:hypothetical protein